MNDAIYYMKKNKKLICFSIFIFMTILFMYFFSTDYSSEELFVKTFGLNCNFKEGNWLEIFSLIFCSCIYIYISFSIFIKDMQNNVGNIFLRISTRKWILYKIVSIFIISFISLFFNYIVLILTLFFIRHHFVPLIVFPFLNHIIYIYIIQLLSLFIFDFINTNSKIILLSILIILIMIVVRSKTIFSIISIELIYLSFLCILSFILYAWFIPKKINLIFEIVKEKWNENWSKECFKEF